MAFDLNDMLESLHGSRRFFLKHLQGLAEEQWDWKPYPECKSIRETLVHLVGDDRAALQALETGGQPDYDGIENAAFQEAQGDQNRAQAMLEESHRRLCDYIASRFAGAPLDTEVSLWGSTRKLGSIGYLASEDFYHAGQVAFIRMATDPAWDYYGSIYSEQ